MMIWILFAVLTVAATLTVLIPLARRELREDEGDDIAAAPDVAIYKDQLSEIDRDVARGVMAGEEAESARAEIARRLIRAAHNTQEGPQAANGGRRSLFAAILSVMVLPGVALGLYLWLGSPKLPDLPRSARISDDQGARQLEQLVGRVEAHLANNPEDGRGWSVIAPVYMRMGRAQDAVKAYRNAIRINGETARGRSDLGEAIVLANGGIVTADARKAFERAVELDPEPVKPRFYLALGLGQEGKTKQAIAAWNQLMAQARGTESWVSIAQRELRRLGVDMSDGGKIVQGSTPETHANDRTRAAGTVSGSDLPGPDAGDVAAANAMSSGERNQMIAGMVERLATRLAQQGGSADEWLRLIHAYQVMGRQPEIDDAIALARKDLADKPDDLARFEAAASDAGAARSVPSAPAAPATPPSASTGAQTDGAITGSEPDAADIAAAKSMTPQERQAMIAGMVARLDQRLEADGGSAQDWVKLVRAYMVLGKREEALDALKRARGDLVQNPEGLSLMDAIAERFALGS